MVQEAIADSYASINMLRLLVLWTAWTIDNSQHPGGPHRRSPRASTPCAKVAARRVLPGASTCIGSLGVTDLTPLQAHVGRRADA